MIFAQILASGKGNRFGSDLPKQFLLLHQKPILIKSIEAFNNNEQIDKIVVVVSDEYLDYTKRLIKQYVVNSDKIVVITGGATRTLSLMAGIDYIKDNYDINKNDIVLTHDGVRCFVNQRIISDNIKALESCDCVTTAIKTIDTIFEVKDDKVKAALNRDELYNVQTPQSFKINKLIENYQKLTQQQKDSLTDGCKIFALNQQEVRIVTGEEYNIKITTPYDYQQALMIEDYLLGNCF